VQELPCAEAYHTLLWGRRAAPNRNSVKTRGHIHAARVAIADTLHIRNFSALAGRSTLVRLQSGSVILWEQIEDPSPVQIIVATVFDKFCVLAASILLGTLAVSAQDLPGGTALEVRLSRTTGSRISHRGDPIEATIIAPISVRGRVVVQQGSKLLGSVTNATAIGLGLKHSTASLSYGFHTLLVAGIAIPIDAQLVEVETAKELVDDRGIVRGIHAIVSLSSGVAYCAVPLILMDPAIGVPVWGVKSVIAPSANPEILFPMGTELILRLSTAVTLPAPKLQFSAPAKSFSPAELTDIQQLLKASEQRAYMGSRPSDIVNVMFIGGRAQLDRAFHASGWSQAQRKSPISLYRMYRALAKRRGYPRAPMNRLTLNGAPSAFVQQKSLDTVQKRHHVRLWQVPLHENIWLGAAAEDVGFRFELTHWTHSTDPNIDSERAKIVNDLAFAGCVDAAGLLSRHSADLVQDPKAQYPIVTDGDIAVVRLNDCIQPTVMAGVGEPSVLRQRGRMVRALTAFRDDLKRSNIIFTTYNTLRLLKKHKADPTTSQAPLVNGEPRGLDWLPPIEIRSEQLPPP
jgi:hypothetical protein